MNTAENFDFQENNECAREENTAPNEALVMEAAVEIISSYVSNNLVDPQQLVELIPHVFQSLKGLMSSAPETEYAPIRRSKAPVVPIKKSVTDDYLICLEDGKKLKMLKRHLRTVYKMTPEQYRRRWNLPDNYPMVAPNYTKKRSALARSHGLGLPRDRAEDYGDALAVAS